MPETRGQATREKKNENTPETEGGRWKKNTIEMSETRRQTSEKKQRKAHQRPKTAGGIFSKVQNKETRIQSTPATRNRLTVQVRQNERVNPKLEYLISTELSSNN